MLNNSMQIKHAPADLQSMAQDGDAILRSLQNKTLPIVDLMVRESLQNSLDATIEGTEFTDVKYTVGQFESSDLAKYFEEIDDVLSTKYAGKQEFIAVSDKNTYGLTGDYKSEDKAILDASNFHKLVFSIGKNQDKDGAGGSWGLGKTSYFRMGVGLVIYYTRVLTEDGYEERLIGSMIESPKSRTRILKNNSRGIAWWGTYSEDATRIYPITDKNLIRDILSIFNVSNYVDDETGTTIIVPYIKKEESIIGNEQYPWEKELEKEVSMAIQRWYFPRVHNISYRGKLGNSYLNVKVNDELLSPDLNFEPVFNIYKDLYTSALIGKSNKETINVLPIKLGNNALANLKNPLGHVAYMEVSREQLEMNAPNNKPSGLAYLGIKDESVLAGNSAKVMAYCRKPGMIVEYSVNGTWMPSEMVQKDDHLLLAIFVPESDAVLHSNYHDKGYEKLETYLRATENSDHATWADEDKVTIIKRISNACSTGIRNFYRKDDEQENTTATSSISRKFGALLMPPTNFGKSPRGTGGEKKDKELPVSKNRNSDVSIVKTKLISDSVVSVEFKVFMKKNSTSLIYLQLISQDKKIDKKYWDEKIDDQLAFPVGLVELNVKDVNGAPVSAKNTPGLKIGSIDSKLEGFKIISKLNEDITIGGLITLKILSNQYLPNLAIKSLANEE